MESGTIIITYDKIEHNRYVRTITFNDEFKKGYLVETNLNFEILNNMPKDELKNDFDKCVLLLKNKPLKMYLMDKGVLN